MKYNPALDGLRAIAALVVVAAHSQLLGGGTIGVDVFFVLSGFLITSILTREIWETGRLNLWRFYGHRATRLYPPLLIMLAVWAVLIMPGSHEAWRIAVVAFYLTDYWIAFSTLGGGLGHTWSLAVEEHFYMFWPLVLLALPRRPVLFLAIAFVLATAWRWIDFTVWNDVRRTVYRFDTNLAALILGGLIAVLPWRPHARQARAMGIAGATGLAALLAVYEPGSLAGITIGVTFANLASSALILSLAVPGTPAYRVLGTPSLVYLGQLSYSIYLWHYPIAVMVRQVMPPVGTFVIVTGLSIAFAAASFHLVERPLRDWRHQGRGMLPSAA